MSRPDAISMRLDDMVSYYGTLTLGQDAASRKRDEAIEAMLTVANRFRRVIPRAASRARSAAIDSNCLSARSVSASVRNLLAKNPRTAATAAKHNKKRMRPAQTVASREIDLDRRDLDLIKAVLLESEVNMVDGEGDVILVIRLFRVVLCSLCVERAGMTVHSARLLS
jgi:hypothetical protein